MKKNKADGKNHNYLGEALLECNTEFQMINKRVSAHIAQFILSKYQQNLCMILYHYLFCVGHVSHGKKPSINTSYSIFKKNFGGLICCDASAVN